MIPAATLSSAIPRQPTSSVSQNLTDLNSEVKSQIADSVNFQILEKNFADYISISTDANEQDSQPAATYSKPIPTNAATQSTTSQMEVSAESHETMQFSVEVDGQKVTLSIETLRWMHAEVSTSQINKTKEAVRKSDPLVLDLTGDGITTSGIQQGVQFDLNADGMRETISAPTADNKLLAWDKNNNGVIDNGSELFGDSNGYKNGFDALKALDSNNDGKIDAADNLFSQLKLMSFDANGKQTLSDLSQAVTSINLNYQNQQANLGNADEISQVSSFQKTNGKTQGVYDLLLSYSNKP